MGREALAEAMIPVIGRLYRENNVVTSMNSSAPPRRPTLFHLFSGDRLAVSVSPARSSREYWNRCSTWNSG